MHVPPFTCMLYSVRGSKPEIVAELKPGSIGGCLKT